MVVLEVIEFEASDDTLEQLIQHGYGEGGVVAVQGSQHDSQQVHIAELDLARLDEDLPQIFDNLIFFPVELANLLDDFLQSLLVQVKVHQFADVQLQSRTLFLLNSRTLGRVDIVDRVLQEHALLLAQVLCRLLSLQSLQERAHTRGGLGVA